MTNAVQKMDIVCVEYSIIRVCLSMYVLTDCMYICMTHFIPHCFVLHMGPMSQHDTTVHIYIYIYIVLRM